jgi:hypothetical protein
MGGIGKEYGRMEGGSKCMKGTKERKKNYPVEFQQAFF